jgi:hypothetical protein
MLPVDMTLSSDGRLLARLAPGGAVAVFDVATGKEVLKRKGHARDVTCLAFAPDGKALATGSEDGTALLWDLSAVRPTEEPRRPGALTELELKSLWEDLAAEDGAQAYRAVLALAADSGRSVPFLAGRFRLSPDERKRLAHALAGLDDDDFEVREKSSRELEKLGEPAEAALRQARKGSESAEVRRRLQQLLERLDAGSPTAGQLRRMRAAEVMERAGTPDARQALELLRKGG